MSARLRLISAATARACWCALVLALLVASAAVAQSSGGAYVLKRERIAAGGGRALGGNYQVDGTIAQHDASNVQSGGVFELTGGFRRRAASAADLVIFANGFE